jgi:hypothetical protein
MLCYFFTESKPANLLSIFFGKNISKIVTLAPRVLCLRQAVFNCALNPAMKKKKLPSVLPPPPPPVMAGKMEVPFWKEPLPQFESLPSEWDPPSTKDIGQKLQVGLCYGRIIFFDFRRFFTIFGEKLGIFLKKTILRSNFCKN